MTLGKLRAAVILAATVAEKPLRAVAPLGSVEYAVELRFLLRAALAYKGAR